VETNLARLADAAQEKFGDYPSLFCGGDWFSFADLHRRAMCVGGGLRLAGVAPGDCVVVIMANCPEVGIAYQAVWRAGAVITPVVFLVTSPELRHIIDDSGAVAVVTTPELVPKVAAATEGLDRRLPIFVVGENFAELESAEPGPIVDRSPDDLAALLYTGGTTGRSKGVALSHANLSNAGASGRAVSHVPGLVRGITALPLSHSFGLLVTVGALHTPEPTVSILQRWFEPREWLALAAEHHAQTTAVVPSMLAILLGQPLEDFDLSALEFVFSGAAPLSAAVAREFARRVPSATVLEGYGCTETAGLISSTPPRAPRPGTVGKAVPNVSIRIVGPDGRDVPTGGDGEIVVRGPNVMAHYWRGEPITGGWFGTGDVGRLDDDGYLTIVDRIKDLILRGGFNVYPRDVEDALMTHAGVAMAAVVGRPDERLGEEVVAFVALTDGATVTAEELVAYARDRLGAHKYPREVHIVDAVPLTSVGKLDRKRLRAVVASPADGAIPAQAQPPAETPV
jgi:long-chain acyl-CoA synthetase